MRVFDFIYRAIIATAMGCTLTLASCGVHELPQGDPVLPEIPTYPAILYLDYETDLPLYKTIENQLESRSAMAIDYDVRYIIETYKVVDEQLNRKELLTREIFTRDDVNTLNYSQLFRLPEGKYEFYVWTDYVDAGTTGPKFYIADDFSTITVHNHEGNNDFRDAYAGTAQVEIKKPEPNAANTDKPTITTVSEIRVINRRPLAKFNFITTDLDRFVEHMLELEAQAKAESEKNEGQEENPRSDDPAELASTSANDTGTAAEDHTRGVNIKDYKVVFRYSQFMPNEFDLFSYIPVYALPQISFESEITPISDTEAELGFDYVFVNGEEFVIPIIVEVYDKQGNKVSGINPINVPLMRGQLTTIRDNFLTSQASGGIGINPSFNGPDHIYEVP